MFSKGFFPRGLKRCHCVGMGYTISKTNSIIQLSKLRPGLIKKNLQTTKKSGPNDKICPGLVRKHCGERRKCYLHKILVTSIFSFSHNVFKNLSQGCYKSGYRVYVVGRGTDILCEVTPTVSRRKPFCQNTDEQSP